jgi:2-haloacid dehalogenase
MKRSFELLEVTEAARRARDLHRERQRGNEPQRAPVDSPQGGMTAEEGEITMALDRREFLGVVAGTVVAGTVAAGCVASAPQPQPPSSPQPQSPARAPAQPPPGARSSRVEVVAFDAFPIFDPRPIAARVESFFPSRGAELSGAWRTRQFEYQWLRALGGHYADFWQTTSDALRFAASMLQLPLTSDQHDQLMQMYLELKPWPDVAPALAALKQTGVALAFLSNMTKSMLETNIASAGLTGMFDQVLSTDAARTYKPDPRAYHLALDAFGVDRHNVAFVAFAGWDAAGAGWFGYPTFWVNRLGTPVEALGTTPDATSTSLANLVDFVSSRRT